MEWKPEFQYNDDPNYTKEMEKMKTETQSVLNEFVDWWECQPGEKTPGCRRRHGTVGLYM